MLKELSDALLNSPIIIDENPIISLEHRMKVHKEKMAKEKRMMKKAIEWKRSIQRYTK